MAADMDNIDAGGGWSPATPRATTTSYMPSGGTMMAAAGFVQAYAASQAQEAAAINQQTGYMVTARDNLVVANIRADMSEQYAMIQAGRTLKKAENESLNYKIAGNSLLKNMRATNAALRARAAAGGVSAFSGSIDALQIQNVDATMRDVGIADLNSLAAKVLGFEDASAMIQSTSYQNILNEYAASRQSGQYDAAATAARQQGGLLSDATLLRGAYDYAKTRG